MEDQVAVIFQELNPMGEQYKLEMPGKRRAWPESIKKRNFQLLDMGIGAREVAAQSCVAYQTVYAWGRARELKKPFSG